MQSIYDRIRATTGSPLPVWARIVKGSRLEKREDVVSYLEQEYGLGHNPATLIADAVLTSTTSSATPEADRAGE